MKPKGAAASETASESQIIEAARGACSGLNWVLGECAAEWTRAWAKGRGDADFAVLVGDELTAGKVGRCRRVWESFIDIRGQFPKLHWSHFDKARAFGEHAEECLEWAAEVEATVAEMNAWGRATWPGLEAVAEQESPEAGAGVTADSEHVAGHEADRPDKEESGGDKVQEQALPGESSGAASSGPPPDASRTVAPVIRSLRLAIESLKQGAWQRASVEQQSEVMELVEGFKAWVSQ